jgi:hypothetical protein
MTPEQLRLKTEKDNIKSRGAKLVSIIEDVAPELMNGFRGDYSKSQEKALLLRIEDIKEQMVQNRDHSNHIELVGRVLALREVIATLQYARM